MFQLIDRLVTNESFALQAWDDRYSKGVWVGLSPNEYDLDVIRGLSSAGDLDMIPATDFVLSADWLPIVTGRTLVEAMSTLETRLAGLPSEQMVRASDWARSVSDAFNYLSRASRKCQDYGEMDGKLKPLPEKYNGKMPDNF